MKRAAAACRRAKHVQEPASRCRTRTRGRCTCLRPHRPPTNACGTDTIRCVRVCACDAVGDAAVRAHLVEARQPFLGQGLAAHITHASILDGPPTHALRLRQQQPGAQRRRERACACERVSRARRVCTRVRQRASVVLRCVGCEAGKAMLAARVLWHCSPRSRAALLTLKEWQDGTLWSHAAMRTHVSSQHRAARSNARARVQQCCRTCSRVRTSASG